MRLAHRPLLEALLPASLEALIEDLEQPVERRLGRSPAAVAERLYERGEPGGVPPRDLHRKPFLTRYLRRKGRFRTRRRSFQGEPYTPAA